MQDYDITADFSDQQQNNLKILLGLTFLLGLIACGFRLNAAREELSFPDANMWLSLVTFLLVANELRRRKRPTMASWVYLSGLLLVFSLSLLQYGPSLNVYLLFLAVPVMACLLLDKKHLSTVSTLAAGLMFGLTLIQVGLLPTLAWTAMPMAFCLLSGAVLYTTATNALEMIYWATDIQRKDA